MPEPGWEPDFDDGDYLPQEHVWEWIVEERATHAKTKYGEGEPGRVMLIEEMRAEGYGEKWRDFIGNYLKRAELFGVQTPQGRQAMGKAIVSLLHCLETACQEHGMMPLPGKPSGEIERWPSFKELDALGGD